MFSSERFCAEVLRGEDGFVYTCDGPPGHDGPHHDVQFDISNDCFRFAEWPAPPPQALYGVLQCQHTRSGYLPDAGLTAWFCQLAHGHAGPHVLPDDAPKGPDHA